MSFVKNRPVHRCPPRSRVIGEFQDLLLEASLQLRGTIACGHGYGDVMVDVIRKLMSKWWDITNKMVVLWYEHDHL